MKATILVIEDNPITRKAMRVALTCEGYEVLEAGTGAGALALMAQHGPDLVLQDLTLSDIDGFELRPKLAQAATRPTPIIAHTGYTDEKKILAAGFHAALIKPIDPFRLVEVVGAHLAASSPGTESAPSLGKVLLVDDDSTQLRLDTSRLQHAGLEVVGALDAEGALEVLKTFTPQVVVTDICMPGVDGFELCRALRADARLSGVPILLLTQHNITSSHRHWAARFGANAVMQRSSSMQPLIKTVRSLLIDKTGSGLELHRAEAVADVVDQLQQQQQLKASLQARERTLNSISAMIARLSGLLNGRAPLPELLSEILAGFLDSSGFPLGAAYLQDDDGYLELSARLGFPAEDDCASFGRLPLFTDVIGVGAPRGFDSSGSTGERRLLERAGAAAAAIVPLTFGSTAVGALFLASTNPVLPTGWADFAAAVASPISHAIALARTVAQIASSEQRFRGIAESTANGIVLADPSGQVSYVNPAAEGMLGRASDGLLGRPYRELLPERGAGEKVAVLQRQDGSELSVGVTSRSFEHPPGHLNQMFVIRDLSDERRIEKLSIQANRDPLTGLFNRRRFEEDLASRLSEANRHRIGGALLVLDLDRFKPINDTHGHQAGDAVLRAVADALRTISRDSDTLARFGGDEFVVLLNHVTAEGAVSYATKAMKTISGLEVAFEGKTLGVGVSIGLATYPGQASTPHELFAAADEALYAAKTSGRNCVVVSTRPATETAAAGTAA